MSAFTVLCNYSDGTAARVQFDGEIVHTFSVGGLLFSVVHLTNDYDFPITKFQVALGDLCVRPLGDELPLNAMDDVDVDEFTTRAIEREDLVKDIETFTAFVAASPERFPGLD